MGTGEGRWKGQIFDLVPFFFFLSKEEILKCRVANVDLWLAGILLLR